jgi:hypothetical protein
MSRSVRVAKRNARRRANTAGKQTTHAGFAQHLVDVGRSKVKAEIAKQKHEFGVDAEGAAEATAAAEAYAREKSKRRVKAGLEKDPNAVKEWDVVRYVDRYGEEHFVSPAMAEKMQEEYEAELKLEEEGELLPCPQPVRLAKQPSFDSIRVRINWQPPNDYCHADEVHHAIVKWSQVHNQHRDPRDIGLFDDQFAYEGGRVESITIEKESSSGKKRQRVVKNKRSRFVEIGDLHPNTDYEVRVSFVYDKDVVKFHKLSAGHLHAEDAEHDHLEGADSEPLLVRTGKALLQCGDCGATLNWGLKKCPKCEGSDASLSAWNRK